MTLYNHRSHPYTPTNYLSINHFIYVEKKHVMGLIKLLLTLSIVVLSLTSLCTNSLHDDDLHNNYIHEYGYDFSNYPLCINKIQRPFSDQLAKTINVLNFGAKGDGSTDDTKVSN